MHKTKKAFTLLEVVMVLVILGIVASIGSSLIVQVYESYLIQKSVHNAGLKSELAVTQLANRLSYRIDRSMLARQPGSTGIVEGTDVYAIRDVPITDVNIYTALEWIGYENDGFSASTSPAWSGFCDFDASTSDTISTTGSTLTNETAILTSLGGAAGNPAVIFLGESRYKTTGETYEAIDMYHANGSIFPVTITDDTTLTFITGGGDRTAGDMLYTEFYQLLASAYAIVPENQDTINGVTVWDLALYSNYQPWLGDNYEDGERSILAKNVSVFRFKQENKSLRIKICTIEQTSLTDQIASCKEKAVIR